MQLKELLANEQLTTNLCGIALLLSQQTVGWRPERSWDGDESTPYAMRRQHVAAAVDSHTPIVP
jgi:hypothetical protein